MASLPVSLLAVWLCITLLVSLAVGHPATVATRDSARTSFSLDTVHNPNFARNGPLAYSKALTKYGAELPDGFFDAAQIKGAVGSVPAWNQSFDREYLSPILIGTPAQVVMLDIDTGSSDLWIFSTDTQIMGFNNRHIYRPHNSSTSTRQENTTWYITYGDQSYATGLVYTDDIQLGEITVRNATVESATTAAAAIVDDPTISGLLGLSFNHSSTVMPRMPTLLDQLTSEHDVNVFSADLKYHDKGKYVFGEIDHAAYNGDISWQPILPGSNFWQIHMSIFQLGNSPQRLIYQWPVIVDTGTTLALLQEDLAQLYWDQVPGARYDMAYPGWVFPCNATLPDLIFGFNNDKWTGVVPGEYINYQALPAAGECYGGVQGNRGLQFAILGDVLLKAVFVVFDAENERVGFANKDLH